MVSGTAKILSPPPPKFIYVLKTYIFPIFHPPQWWYSGDQPMAPLSYATEISYLGKRLATFDFWVIDNYSSIVQSEPKRSTVPGGSNSGEIMLEFLFPLLSTSPTRPSQRAHIARSFSSASKWGQVGTGSEVY